MKLPLGYFGGAVIAAGTWLALHAGGGPSATPALYGPVDFGDASLQTGVRDAVLCRPARWCPPAHAPGETTSATAVAPAARPDLDGYF